MNSNKRRLEILLGLILVFLFLLLFTKIRLMIHENRLDAVEKTLLLIGGRTLLRELWGVSPEIRALLHVQTFVRMQNIIERMIFENLIFFSFDWRNRATRVRHRAPLEL